MYSLVYTNCYRWAKKITAETPELKNNTTFAG